MAKLSNKQQLFVASYISNGLNATKAAIEAGYSAKTARAIGCENLTKPDIKTEIERQLEQYAMSAREVLARLTDMARADLGEFLDYTFEELSKHPKSYLLRKVKRTVRRSRKNDEEVETFEFELHDPQNALVQLGRYHDLTNKVRIEDWRDQAIRDIAEGKLSVEALIEAFGGLKAFREAAGSDSLAARLFALVGLEVIE